MQYKLEEWRVNLAPSTIYYIPNFISDEDESEIMKNVYSSPKPKWTNLSNRRLQDYGGVPHKNGMIVEEIPQWLQKYMDRINSLKVFEMKNPNHVLINEYLPNQGIMPHTDGPLFHPCVTTISCGSHTILEFSDESNNRCKVCDLVLERKSLVIIKDDMYSNYLHSISARSSDILNENCVNLDNTLFKVNDLLIRDTRISLTIRNVPKVCKLKLWR